MMISSPLSHAYSPPKYHHKLHRLSSPSSTTLYVSPIKMSSTIEHVVLLKVKQNTDADKINTMVNDLNALSSLSQVLYLTTGPVQKIQPASAYTHMLHGRIKSKFDLFTYLISPQHVSAVINSVLPICDTVMIVDYSRPGQPENPRPGSGIRATLVKTKEGSGNDKDNEVMGILRGEISKYSEVENSVGENFMPFVNKGYGIGSVEIFSGLDQLEESATQKVKLKDCVDEMLVVDYVIP